MKPLSLITLLLFLTCSYDITEYKHQGIDPILIFYETATYYWYKDSNYDSLIIPPGNVFDTSGIIIVFIGPPDYMNATLPEEIYGLIRYNTIPNDSLHCIDGDCEMLGDTIDIDMQNYFDSLNVRFE